MPAVPGRKSGTLLVLCAAFGQRGPAPHG